MVIDGFQGGRIVQNVTFYEGTDVFTGSNEVGASTLERFDSLWGEEGHTCYFPLKLRGGGSHQKVKDVERSASSGEFQGDECTHPSRHLFVLGFVANYSSIVLQFHWWVHEKRMVEIQLLLLLMHLYSDYPLVI